VERVERVDIEQVGLVVEADVDVAGRVDVPAAGVRVGPRVLVPVVRDSAGYAMYFSRSVIPHPRNAGAEYFKHIGIYMYSRATLLHATGIGGVMES